MTKPSDKDILIAQEFFRRADILYTELELEFIAEFVKRFLAAERASLPESVELALNSLCRDRLSHVKALAEIKEWQQGDCETK
jgi:hypothetical protein